MLSERLELAVHMAGQVRSFADIGADHGFLSAELLKRNPEAQAFVTDISEKALSKARRLLSSLRLEGRAEFSVSNGLEMLKAKRVETVFVLGMGGETLAGILKRGCDCLHGAELIISGQTDIPMLRKTVWQIDYHIEEERIAREKERYYFLLRCKEGRGEKPSEKELYLGRYLLETMPEVWKHYLKKQEIYLRDGISAMERANQDKDQDRKREFEEKLASICSVLDCYEKGECGYEGQAGLGMD